MMSSNHNLFSVMVHKQLLIIQIQNCFAINRNSSAGWGSWQAATLLTWLALPHFSQSSLKALIEKQKGTKITCQVLPVCSTDCGCTRRPGTNSPRVDVVDAVGGHVGVAVNLQRRQRNHKEREADEKAARRRH